MKDEGILGDLGGLPPPISARNGGPHPSPSPISHPPYAAIGSSTSGPNPQAVKAWRRRHYPMTMPMTTASTPNPLSCVARHINQMKNHDVPSTLPPANQRRWAPPLQIQQPATCSLIRRMWTFMALTILSRS